MGQVQAINDTTGHTQRILFEQNDRKHIERIATHRDLSTTGENDRRQLSHQETNDKASGSKHEDNIRRTSYNDGEEWYTCKETGARERVWGESELGQGIQ